MGRYTKDQLSFGSSRRWLHRDGTRIQISRPARWTDRLVQSKGSESMRAYVSCIALGFALVAGTPIANAQSLITQPYEIFIVQPSGTLATQPPLVAVSAGVVQPVQAIQAIETVPCGNEIL